MLSGFTDIIKFDISGKVSLNIRDTCYFQYSCSRLKFTAVEVTKFLTRRNIPGNISKFSH